MVVLGDFTHKLKSIALKCVQCVPIRMQRLIIVLLTFFVLYALFQNTHDFLQPVHHIPDEAENQMCHIPKLDVDDPEVLRYLKYQGPLQCSEEEDWVEIDGNVATITEKAKRKHGPIKCSFVEIIRSTDYSTFAGPVTVTSTEFNLENSDFFRVSCEAEDGQKWENTMAGIRLDEDILDKTGWEMLPEKCLKMNVLMFGFDSISRMTLMRKLPKTYAKLKELHAIVLEGYNIIGDGTPQALIPILTGRTELELPDTRKRMGDRATYVNAYPFIWNDMKASGYVTAYMEDTPEVGVFTYRLKGFHDEPTDHYMRTFYVDASPTFYNQKPYCMGSKPRHTIMLDYAKHIYTVYPSKPKFIFGFHGEISHDSYNLIGAADQDVVDWLEWFREKGHLNDTLLVFMSDHGHRFGKVRETQQGKLEERLPMFAFVFPPWFKTKYPISYKNFEENAHRLTTPLDVYETMKNFLNFDESENAVDNKKAVAMSLFHKIPENRTCFEAGIEMHWCACMSWHTVHDENLARKAANEFVSFINTYNAKYSDLCSVLSLAGISHVSKFVPKKAVMAFKRTYDFDGFLPDLTDKRTLKTIVYQLRITTEPGGGLLEFSTIYNMKEDFFKFKIEDVSRVNAYGNDSWCIKETQEQLRKYCYCKQQFPKGEKWLEEAQGL